jgi:isoquinoline 1-oxidoreductase beta subunit
VLGAQVSAGGRIEAWRARIACPPSAREFGRRLFAGRIPWAAIEDVAGEADPLAVEGLAPSYGIPNLAVDHVPVRLALPTGRMRGGAHGLTCFMVESFVDEIARDHGLEPLSYRIAMLGGDLRLAECLQRAARLAGWDGGAGGSGQGLACHRMGGAEEGGRIAVIAEAGRGERGIEVRRLVAAVDVGRIVNRDIALQQIEGGLLYGLGLALGAATGYEEGLPRNRRLAHLRLPTLADCPRIDVELVRSEAPPFDPGEIGLVAVAPAIANALHSATGLRIRRLPLLSAAP